MNRLAIAALLAVLAGPAFSQSLDTVSGTAVDAPVAAPAAPVIVGASTGHYFRLADVHHLLISAGTLYDLRGLAPVEYVTTVALITHSTADGTIVPPKLQALGISPEDWVPLEVGFGGSAKITGGHLSGNAITTFGTAGNACPLVLGWAVKNIGDSAPLPLQIVKAAILGDGTDYAKLRIGYVFQGQAISDGVFQSAKEMFPGRGVLDIANRAGRFELSVSKRL
jgi:hypothetical protein